MKQRTEGQMSKVWFITGASSGLGRALAEEVLAQGDRVIATARKTSGLRNLVEKYSDAARALTLDVTNLDDVQDSVAQAIKEFGRIDVVVNNAGYGLVGAIEEPSDEQIRQLFETNVFGVLNVLRETLPILRRQKSGHIINISSRLGFTAFPSYGYYSATKYALHGLSEALAQEVAPFGIKVTIAEPGGIRTNFNEKSVVQPENLLPAEYPSTAVFNGYLSNGHGKQFSDPHKIAELLVEITKSEDPPLHLPLGEDAYHKIEEQLNKITEEIARWREKGSATGY
jgi:NAD(P)-dependent dehydrogenase (short-subunit alcohol dehydrogenase family)